MRDKPSKIVPELKVMDFFSSLDFYTRLASFSVLYSWPEESFAMLDSNGAKLMIEGIDADTRFWSIGEMQRPLGRGINLQIEVDDVHAIRRRLVGASYPLYLDVEEKWYRVGDGETGNRQFLVQDPDGYLLRFFRDIGRRGGG